MNDKTKKALEIAIIIIIPGTIPCWLGYHAYLYIKEKVSARNKAKDENKFEG